MGLLLKVFLTFAKVGLFSFGGAYGAIPLIRDVVIAYGWMDEEMLSNMIAVSESTPGPIMVNLATYIGSSKGGLPGAIIATLAVILPSFAHHADRDFGCGWNYCLWHLVMQQT